MRGPWDERFEALLCDLLPALPGGAPLDPEADLLDHGLSSMKIIELMLRIEEAYGAPLPDEQLRFDTFATPAALWTVVAPLAAAPGEGGSQASRATSA